MFWTDPNGFPDNHMFEGTPQHSLLSDSSHLQTGMLSEYRLSLPLNTPHNPHPKAFGKGEALYCRPGEACTCQALSGQVPGRTHQLEARVRQVACHARWVTLHRRQHAHEVRLAQEATGAWVHGQLEHQVRAAEHATAAAAPRARGWLRLGLVGLLER